MSMEERITELEIQSSHQENLISELNDVIISQQRKIDLLEAQVSKMETMVQNMAPNIKQHYPLKEQEIYLSRQMKQQYLEVEELHFTQFIFVWLVLLETFLRHLLNGLHLKELS